MECVSCGEDEATRIDNTFKEPYCDRCGRKLYGTDFERFTDAIES